MDDKRDIFVITADEVKFTGIVSYIFMIDADPQRKLSPMPQKFGYIWQAGERDYAFNVFEPGRGLEVGGGWNQYDTPEGEKQMFDAFPSCTLLMDTTLLPWWNALTARNGVTFRHHHFEGTLKTS